MRADQMRADQAPEEVLVSPLGEGRSEAGGHNLDLTCTRKTRGKITAQNAKRATPGRRGAGQMRVTSLLEFGVVGWTTITAVRWDR